MRALFRHTADKSHLQGLVASVNPERSPGRTLLLAAVQIPNPLHCRLLLRLSRPRRLERQLFRGQHTIRHPRRRLQSPLQQLKCPSTSPMIRNPS
jgi:hypothetical protein